MKLLTKAIIRDTPPLYYNEEARKPTAEIKLYARYFLPGSRWTWYLAELSQDPDNPGLAYGYVLSGLEEDYDEWGYFDMNELQEVRTSVGIIGLGVERDLHFTPKLVKDVKEIKR